MTMGHVGTEGFAAGRLACLNLVHAYNNHIDSGHAERVPELFTEDASLEVGGHALTGIDAIRAAMQARSANTERRTVHASSNVEFTDVSERTAAATSTVLLFVLGVDAPVPQARSSAATTTSCASTTALGASNSATVSIVSGKP